MGKYARACGGDKGKTMQLYRYNLRLCQRFYGALNLFEVMLRNAINEHYATHFADPDWIVNQADIYRDLTHIREFRNRIAHHEPVCFNGVGGISTVFARQHYQLICEYIGYMGHQPDNVLSWSEKPDEILNKIDGIK